MRTSRGLGLIPGPGVTCGFSLLLVLVLAPRVFLRVLQFSTLCKTHIPNSNSKPGNGGQEKLSCGISTAKFSLLLIFPFPLFYSPANYTLTSRMNEFTRFLKSWGFNNNNWMIKKQTWASFPSWLRKA